MWLSSIEQDLNMDRWGPDSLAVNNVIISLRAENLPAHWRWFKRWIVLNDGRRQRQQSHRPSSSAVLCLFSRKPRLTIRSATWAASVFRSNILPSCTIKSYKLLIADNDFGKISTLHQLTLTMTLNWIELTLQVTWETKEYWLYYYKLIRCFTDATSTNINICI